MTRQYRVYTKEQLEPLIQESISFSDALKKMGRKPVGGSITNLTLTCKRLGISTDHLLGQSHAKGKVSSLRKKPMERLVMGNPTDRRVDTYIIRKALFELGIEHNCVICGINEWQGRKLVLEIDHIDNQYWNNQPENLRFLCPNCHSQK